MPRGGGHNGLVATFKKVRRSSLGAIIGAFLGAFAWYSALVVVGVDGLTNYVDEPPQRSYIWLVAVICTGPVIGLLAGSVVGWRRRDAVGRSQP
jgi:uncharacterized protein YqgC (DUF456 family)